MPRQIELSDLSQKTIRRFWSKVAISSNIDACWPWRAYRNTRGYGMFGTSSYVVHLANRVAYAISKGTTPGDVFILHRCDNPACVNPKHLFPGNQKDNMSDAKLKGRRASVIGTKNPRAKLTEEQVIAIRADARRQTAIAMDYGVTQNMVSRIKTMKSWTHL